MQINEIPLHSHQAASDLRIQIDLAKHKLVFGNQGDLVLNDVGKDIVDGRLFTSGSAGIILLQYFNHVEVYMINSKANLRGYNVTKTVLTSDIITKNACRPLECIYRHVCFQMLFNESIPGNMFNYGSQVFIKLCLILSHLFYRSQDQYDSYSGTYKNRLIKMTKEEIVITRNDDIIFKSNRIHKLQRTHFK